MNNEFYRFRSINSLLGDYKELETQTIYFAEPETLNDPMEGYRDIYWVGGFMMWKSLFKNYLFHLERITFSEVNSTENQEINIDDIPICSRKGECIGFTYKKILLNISQKFFKNDNVNNLLERLSKRKLPVRQGELKTYLKAIHAVAIEVIYSEYEDSNIILKRIRVPLESNQLIEYLIGENFVELMERSTKDDNLEIDFIDTLSRFIGNMELQDELLSRFNQSIDNKQRNNSFNALGFNRSYIFQLENLIFPNWYTACFMSECTNSSVWGHYGDSHKGVCLVFNSEVVDSESFLKLKGINGYNSKDVYYGFNKHIFYPIDYEIGFGDVDFFHMIAHLPVDRLHSKWYTIDSTTSEITNYSEEYKKVDEKDYQKIFYRDILRKSKDWSYENEYRLILSSSFVDFSDAKERTLEYEFSSLKGIIFGINTTIEDKLKIMEIIKKKCNESTRQDFKFYQASYSTRDKCITHAELNLLNFGAEE